MNKFLRYIFITVALISFAPVISAQDLPAEPDSVPADTIITPRNPRKITPVDSDDEKPREVLHYYDKHGNPLPEPVRFLAVLDTVTKPKPKPLYPLYNGCTLGVNFADAILWLTGQRHAGFDIWADVSLFNWIFPVIEAGVGFADYTPKKGNFTYKTSPSFYTKIGFNYNFRYKSDPAYQYFIGFRAGFSSFSYDLENVTISNDYWQETTDLSMRGLKAYAFYGEVVGGLKVKITGRFSLGWTARWHTKFKVSSKSTSTPWYIPGYGATSPFGFSLSAMWRFGQDKIEQTEIK